MLAKARSESTPGGGASVDDDIILEEYFSDEKHKIPEKLEM